MDDLDPEIVEMQNAYHEEFRRKRRWIIVEEADGYSMHEWSIDGVAPPSAYPTKRQVAARLLQLFHIGPVAPQTWPESVCIGSISIEEESA